MEEQDRVLKEYARDVITKLLFVDNVTVDMLHKMIRDDETDVVIQNFILDNHRHLITTIEMRDEIKDHIRTMGTGNRPLLRVESEIRNQWIDVLEEDKRRKIKQRMYYLRRKEMQCTKGTQCTNTMQ